MNKTINVIGYEFSWIFPTASTVEIPNFKLHKQQWRLIDSSELLCLHQSHWSSEMSSDTDTLNIDWCIVTQADWLIHQLKLLSPSSLVHRHGHGCNVQNVTIMTDLAFDYKVQKVKTIPTSTLSFVIDLCHCHRSVSKKSRKLPPLPFVNIQMHTVGPFGEWRDDDISVEWTVDTNTKYTKRQLRHWWCRCLVDHFVDLE